MSEVNKNQKDFWSGKGGDIWVERQNAMDTMLSPLGEAALNKLNFTKNVKNTKKLDFKLNFLHYIVIFKQKK